jgi:hypothetical protein
MQSFNQLKNLPETQQFVQAAAQSLIDAKARIATSAHTILRPVVKSLDSISKYALAPTTCNSQAWYACVKKNTQRVSFSFDYELRTCAKIAGCQNLFLALPYSQRPAAK